MQLGQVFERAAEFDIVHSHVYCYALPFARLTSTPIVQTFHILPTPDFVRYCRLYPECRNVLISEFQRSSFGDVPVAGVIYNGIDTKAFPFCAEPGSYLAFLGDMRADKGPLEAIRVARATSVPLKLAGPRTEYFEEFVRPEVDGDSVTYAGEVGPCRRRSRCSAALSACCSSRPPGESCPLVVLESLACGTPVLAIRHGPMTELMKDGCGILVDRSRRHGRASAEADAPRPWRHPTRSRHPVRRGAGWWTTTSPSTNGPSRVAALMSTPRRPTLILAGIVGRYPVGGVTWCALHYIAGFQRLGYDVFYLEDTGECGYDPVSNGITKDPAYAVRYIRKQPGPGRPGAELDLRRPSRALPRVRPGPRRGGVQERRRDGEPLGRMLVRAPGVRRAPEDLHRHGSRVHPAGPRRRGACLVSRLLRVPGHALHLRAQRRAARLSAARHPLPVAPDRAAARARVLARDGGAAARSVHHHPELAHRELRYEQGQGRRRPADARPAGAKRTGDPPRDRRAGATGPPAGTRLGPDRRRRRHHRPGGVSTVHPGVAGGAGLRQGDVRGDTQRVVQRPHAVLPGDGTAGARPGHRVRRTSCRAARASSPSPPRRICSTGSSASSPTRAPQPPSPEIAEECFAADTVVARLLNRGLR